jgi:hypothetical protein
LPQLLSLPFELLSTILGGLPRADLCSLCLTCKKTRSRAEPALYARIELDWQWTSVEGENTSSPLFALVYSLQRRPALGSLIQHVTLRGEPDSGDHRRYPKPRPDLAQVIAATTLVQRASLPYGEVFTQELPKGNMDAWGAVLLSQLSSVTTLVVKHQFATIALMGHVLRAGVLGAPANHTLPAFLTLRKVAWDAMFVSNISFAPEILSFFYLPEIREISLVTSCPRNLIWPSETLPCAPMLTALRLDNIREGLLGRILSSTPNLQKFHWHWLYREDRGCRPGDGIVRDVIDCDQIVHDLYHVKHSLSELVITAE